MALGESTTPDNLLRPFYVHYIPVYANGGVHVSELVYVFTLTCS